MVVVLLSRSRATRHARAATPRACSRCCASWPATPGFLLALAVIFTLQTVDRSFSPILPLFVEQLGVPTDRIATVAGLLFSLIAVCAALGHRMRGRVMPRWSPRAHHDDRRGDRRRRADARSSCSRR